MPSYGGMQPIYQYYLDAQKTRAETQKLQTDTQLDRVKGVMELYGLQQQMQERQIAQQVWGQGQGQQQRQPGVFDPAATGGSQPGANPSTGDDPSMQTAARMDAMAKALAPINPEKSMEWAGKASTIRDQYYTRQTRQLDMQKKQTDLIANMFGSVKDGDQGGYTDALMSLHDSGVNIRAFGLTGNLDADMPALKRIADQSMTYSQKLEAQHRSFSEELDLNKFAWQKQHGSTEEAIGWARVGVAQAGEALRASHDGLMEGYKAKEDARAQAGVARADAMDTQKLKDMVMRPDPGGNDAKYATQLVNADPQLSRLSSDQKKAASVEIQITARRKLADRVKKPTDALPNADDFMDEMQKAAAGVAKRIQPKKAFGIAYGAELAPRPAGGKQPGGTPPLPPAANSRADFDALSVGAQFSKGGKIYKKTGATSYEVIGE